MYFAFWHCQADWCIYLFVVVVLTECKSLNNCCRLWRFWKFICKRGSKLIWKWAVRSRGRRWKISPFSSSIYSRRWLVSIFYFISSLPIFDRYQVNFCDQVWFFFLIEMVLHCSSHKRDDFKKSGIDFLCLLLVDQGLFQHSLKFTSSLKFWVRIVRKTVLYQKNVLIVVIKPFSKWTWFCCDKCLHLHNFIWSLTFAYHLDWEEETQ